MKNYKEYFCKIEIFSNLSILINTELLNLIKELDISVRTTFHKDTYRFKEIFFKNLETLKKLDKIKEFNIIFSNFDEFKKFKDFKDFKEFDYDIIFDYFNIQKLDEKYIKFFEKIDKKYSYLDDWKNKKTFGKTCLVPNKSILVNPDGNIFACQLFFILKNQPLKDLNMFKSLDDLSFLDLNTKCPFRTCFCETEVPKF